MIFKIKLLCNYTKKVLRSPSRMVLTLIGLILSVVILISGLVFSETYLKSKTNEIDLYKKYSAIEVDGAFNYGLYKDISKDSIYSTLELISGFNYAVGNVTYGNKEIKLYISEIRTDNILIDFLNKSVIDTARYKSKLIEGRLIDSSDNEEGKNVVVIGDSLAKFLFGNESAVTKKLIYPIYTINEELNMMEVDYYQELEVIGVIEDYMSIEEYLNNINPNESGTADIVIPVYVPLSFCTGNKSVDDYTMRITTLYSENKYNETVLDVESAIMDYNTDNYTVYSYYSLKEMATQEINTVNRMLSMIVIFMFFISGICITNTMFFSVKERINEIGIRKSIGAENHNIIVQFIYEGVLYGTIAAIIGIMLSVMLDSSLYILLIKNKIWDPQTGLCISKDVIILTFMISVLISTVASIIPALYASKIKISDAIKYD